MQNVMAEMQKMQTMMAEMQKMIIKPPAEKASAPAPAYTGPEEEPTRVVSEATPHVASCDTHP